MIFLLTLPFRLFGLGLRIGAGSAKLTHRTVRFVGYRRVLVLLVGVAIGLLLAPVPGAQLRDKLRQALQGLGGQSPLVLGDKVREELASSPRTWHLPQPGISVDGGTVTLSGDVPHATAAADLQRTVESVKGVTEVVNNLRIV
jgi:hypothetical protein